MNQDLVFIISASIGAILLTMVTIILVIYFTPKRDNIGLSLIGNPKRGKLKVITLSSHDTVMARNFEKTAKRFDYDYYIIGRGKKFKGWSWRTKLYAKTIRKFSKNRFDIFILCDSNDLFFVASSKEMIEKFYANGNKILIGAEPACCTGIYATSEKKRQIAMLKIAERIPDRYRFPNGGFLIGYRNELLDLLDSNKEMKDDQAGYLKMFLKKDPRFFIDTKQELLGNYGSVGIRNRAHDDPNIPEENYWEYDETRRRFKNTITGAYPCGMHFPGAAWKHYNRVISTLFETRKVANSKTLEII